jgi:hypothetical protein
MIPMMRKWLSWASDTGSFLWLSCCGLPQLTRGVAYQFMAFLFRIQSDILPLLFWLYFWVFMQLSWSLMALLTAYPWATTLGLAPLLCLRVHTTCALLPSPSSFWGFYSHSREHSCLLIALAAIATQMPTVNSKKIRSTLPLLLFQRWVF